MLGGYWVEWMTGCMLGGGVDGYWVGVGWRGGCMFGSDIDACGMEVGWRIRCILPSTASPGVGQGWETRKH